MSEITERDAKTGQFLVGHTGRGGRPKGARSRLSEQLIADLAEAWQKHGPDVLERLAKERPAVLLTALVNLMPRHVTLDATVGVDIDSFRQSFRRAVELLHTDKLIDHERP